jgi:hypothetical protein
MGRELSRLIFRRAHVARKYGPGRISASVDRDHRVIGRLLRLRLHLPAAPKKDERRRKAKRWMTSTYDTASHSA